VAGRAKKPASPFRRVVLKLSGEALAGEDKTGINPGILCMAAEEIGKAVDIGIEVAVVIGAGNLFRGAMGESLGIDRITGDHMGMLATVMNSLALHNGLKSSGVESRVMTSIEMKEIAEPYTIHRAVKHLERGRVVIAAGGTGHPFFTTDTAASLRAVELRADAVLKATRVDGVYTADPEKDKSARRMESISFIDVIKNRLGVMDLTSVSLCMENNISIIVFNLFKKGSLLGVVSGEKIGTIIS